MSAKQKGKCPFCENLVAPEIVEENTVRRDRCQCPDCKEEIYLCRSPGCHDFAKGTSVYDHELCPECTEIVSSGLATVGKAVLSLAGTVISGIILASVKKK